MPGLRLVSINIERSRHLDRIIPLLHTVKPDVLCVQELEEPDIPKFVEATGLDVVYCPFGVVQKTSRHVHDNVVEGVAIFALGIRASKSVYYKGSAEAARTTTGHLLQNLAVHSVDLEREGIAYRIATTHFTWVDGGSVSDQQRMDLVRMQNVLDTMGEFVLCGDFNAPRGGEIFSKLAARYKDNIPPEYVWSIDQSLHRAEQGALQAAALRHGYKGLMVDGLFSTPRYEVTHVRLEDGVSDHMAIVARVQAR